MFGTSNFARSLAGALIGLAGLAAIGGSASAAVLPIVNGGTAPGTTGTLLQSVDLVGAGITAFNTVILTDISGGSGGDPGVFSGYDLDAVFLDGDGDITTTGDQIHFTSIAFTGGAIRAGASSHQVPNSSDDVGTYFGTHFDGSGISEAATTLGIFDGVNSASTLSADGFLSMGDGGQIVLTFANILVGDSLFLMFGEVGGQGEMLQVEVSQVPLPGAIWLLLSGIAALFGASRRRSTAIT
jgi:hypothetical protein